MNDYTLDGLMSVMDMISSRAVIKQSKLADKYDVGVPLAPYHEARSAFFKSDSILDYAITYDDLAEYSISPTAKHEIVNDVNTIYDHMSTLDIADLLNDKRDARVTSYEEPNPYYRMLQGLPSTNADVVYFDYPIDGIDITKPVHMFDDVEIQIITVSGDLDKLMESNPSITYLKYINRKVSPFVARGASIFSMIHIDSSGSDNLMMNLFSERYEVHKRRFLAGVYNDFYYKYQTFYEDVMIVYLLGVTMIDAVMIAADTDNIQNNETLEKIYLSEGVPNWNLPLATRVTIGKNLNELVRIRASKKVVLDIASIFGTESVYRYVLDKRLRLTEFDENTPEEDKYDLNFFKVPYKDVDPYPHMHDVTDAISYDSFVADDEKWGTNADNMKSFFMNEKFSYTDTKYISIENMVDLGKVSFELAMFYNFTFDNANLLTNIMGVYDKTQHELTLMNALIGTLALISLKYKYSDNIFKDPEEILYVMGLNTQCDITILRSEFNNEFINTKHYGILDTILEIRDSTTGDQYTNTFLNNIDILYDIKSAMSDELTNISQYNVAKKVYDYLSQIKVVNDVFDGVDTYSEYIQTNDSKLYQRYAYLRELDDESELNLEISDMIEFTKTLLNPSNSHHISERLKFSDEVDISRMNAIRDNLFMIINYFKSYTIDLKDFNTVYNYGDENSGGRSIDWLEVIEYGESWEVNEIKDVVDIEDSDEFNTTGVSKSVLTIIEEGRVVEHVRT